MPYDDTLRAEGQRITHVLAYAEAMVAERAAFAAVVAWRDARQTVSAEHLDRGLHPVAQRHLYEDLMKAEHAAIEAHQAAEAAVREAWRPLSFVRLLPG